jgi:hypothetical protein
MPLPSNALPVGGGGACGGFERFRIRIGPE